MGAGHDTTSYKSLLVGAFNALLKTSKSHTSVQEPIEGTFYSALPQSHRKGEKAFHVKAHRGSKEGTAPSCLRLRRPHQAFFFTSSPPPPLDRANWST